jgi:hypothetical protein
MSETKGALFLIFLSAVALTTSGCEHTLYHFGGTPNGEVEEEKLIWGTLDAADHCGKKKIVMIETEQEFIGLNVKFHCGRGGSGKGKKKRNRS